MAHDWGVFNSGTDGKRHAVPVTDDNPPKVRPPHQLHKNCPCGPKEDYWDDGLLIHNTEH